MIFILTHPLHVLMQERTGSVRAGAKTEGLGIETPTAMQAAVGVLRDYVQTLIVLAAIFLTALLAMLMGPLLYAAKVPPPPTRPYLPVSPTPFLPPPSSQFPSPLPPKQTPNKRAHVVLLTLSPTLCFPPSS